MLAHIQGRWWLQWAPGHPEQAVGRVNEFYSLEVMA
jgi:hypothetical protein